MSHIAAVQSGEKANNLLTLIANGLHTHAERSTALTLGDRSQYIGLSDIGRALECPRAALCNKVYPRSQPSLQKILTLQRGHWLEYGIGQALAAQGLRALPQLELAFMHKSIPIKAHFDFVLVWDTPRPAIRILELKSTASIPDTLYTSYECQLYGQAGLMAYLWNHKAFSLRDVDGSLLHAHLSMPELCKAHFGAILPAAPAKVDIEAWVLCISMDDARPFGPYIPNDSMRDMCVQTAEILWNNKTQLEQGQLDVNTVPHVKGFHALCGYCDWNADCPKFHHGEDQPEWQADLERLAQLKDIRSDLDTQIEQIEMGLRNAYELSGMADKWINAASYRFRVTQHAGRKTLNRDLLQSKLQGSLGDEHAAAKILSRCEVEGRAYTRLNINKIN